MKKRLLSLATLFLIFGLFGVVSAEINAITPSTNDINKTNGWAYVNQSSVGVGTTDLEFISTRSFYSCFEYRTDGDVSQKISDTNYNNNVTDGLYPYVCVNNNTVAKTILADEYVEVRMVFGAERDERFDWTRFDVMLPPFVRSAEITSPTDGQTVSGPVSFDAILVDKDKNDSVQWAVRKGTCAVGTGTVAGNVDGHLNAYTWDHENFHSLLDTSLWVPGSYCFVFNPTESAGDTAIRLTREFQVVAPDDDQDGILNVKDKCSGTEIDKPVDGLGVNRHVWYGGDSFTTLVPAKKGTFVEISSGFSMEDTFGCSCEQILDRMSEVLEQDFNGHYKHGCSKSVIEDWVLGKYYVGQTFIETVEVPALSSSVESVATLDADKDYFLKVYGTALAGDTIEFDAKYSITNRIVGDTWTDLVSGYISYGSSLLDLFVDGVNVDWGTYNPDHIYQIPYEGTGSKLSLATYDIYYPNNGGKIFVDIYEDKWVPLW